MMYSSVHNNIAIAKHINYMWVFYIQLSAWEVLKYKGRPGKKVITFLQILYHWKTPGMCQ